MPIRAFTFASLLLVCAVWPSAQGRSAAVDRMQLLKDLRTLSADDMQGREMGTAGSARARAYIIERFRAAGLESIDGRFEFPFDVPRSGRNARLSGSGINVAGRVAGIGNGARHIVISAHYDHLGVRNQQIFNGADDNASGTAALFAVAAHFRRSRPATSLLIVAFDGEEAGSLGARALVRAPPVGRDSLLFNLNLDMIGRDPNNDLYVAGTRGQPALKSIVEEVAARAPVNLRLGYDDPASRDDWTRLSDQVAFLDAGIPALYVGVSDERHHHRPTDDYDTMTHDFYVRSVETIIRLVEAFDRQAGILASLAVPAAVPRNPR
jgi:hypothetical protein